MAPPPPAGWQRNTSSHPLFSPCRVRTSGQNGGYVGQNQPPVTGNAPLPHSRLGRRRHPLNKTMSTPTHSPCASQTLPENMRRLSPSLLTSTAGYRSQVSRSVCATPVHTSLDKTPPGRYCQPYEDGLSSGYSLGNVSPVLKHTWTTRRSKPADHWFGVCTARARMAESYGLTSPFDAPLARYEVAIDKVAVSSEPCRKSTAPGRETRRTTQ